MRRSAGGERLSAADASNFVIDAPDQVNVFLVAGLLGVGGFVSEGGGVDMARLRAAIADRLEDCGHEDLSRFSRRIRGSWTWEPCAPDLTWHVRLLPGVDGRQGLADVCATLMTVPLPLDRPLWELLIVPGASSAGPGIVLRIHHAVADGVAGVRLVRHLFDSGPAPEEPTGSRLPAAPRAPRQPWRTYVSGARRVLSMFRATVPPTVLLGPISARRGVAFVDVELGRLARGAEVAGATVNDALLAAASVAAESALRAEGQPVPPVLPASVPVALPHRGASGNAVGVMMIPLPTGELDADVRLTRIAAATASAEAEARLQGTFEATRTRWGSRLFALLARRQRFIAFFVTNVRGPDEMLRVAGAPLEHAWPVTPLQGNVRFCVSALSYAGRFGVAVHVDEGALRAGVAGGALAAVLARTAGRQ